MTATGDPHMDRARQKSEGCSVVELSGSSCLFPVGMPSITYICLVFVYLAFIAVKIKALHLYPFVSLLWDYGLQPEAEKLCLLIELYTSFSFMQQAGLSL
jgi:hypothetical protein